MTQAQFYMKVEWEATWEQFQKICHREGGRGEVGRKIMKWVTDYVAVHGDGNPQTILDFAGNPNTLPRWKSCEHSDKPHGVYHGQIYCLLNRPLLAHSMGEYPKQICETCTLWQGVGV